MSLGPSITLPVKTKNTLDSFETAKELIFDFLVETKHLSPSDAAKLKETVVFYLNKNKENKQYHVSVGFKPENEAITKIRKLKVSDAEHTSNQS